MLKEKTENSEKNLFLYVTEALKAVGWQAASAVGGFLLSRVAFFGGYAPFGMAAAAGAPPDLAIAAAAGAAIGYFIPVTGAGGFRYIAAVLAIAAIKALLPVRFKIVRTAGFASLLALVTALITSAAMIASGQSKSSDIVMYIAESLIASGGAYFVHRAMRLRNSPRGISSMTSQELSSVIIVAALMLMALTPIAFGGVSIARIASITLILSAARFGREQAGAISGVAFGFAMAMSGDGMLHLGAAYSLGGLLAGAFAPIGSAGCAAAFVIANGIVSVKVADTSMVMPCIYEALAATALFLIMPRTMRAQLSALFSPMPEMPRLDGLRKTVGIRLRHASEALSDVAATVDEVSVRLGQIDSPEFEDVFDRVENEVCAHCGLRLQCWDTDRKATLADMVALTDILRHGDKLDGLSGRLPNCSRKDALMKSLTVNFGDYNAHRLAQQRVDEVRSVVSDQFDGISEMLAEMAVDFERSQRYDIAAAERVDSALKNIGITASDIGCSIDKWGRMTVEARIDSSDPRRINKMDIMYGLAGACDRDFDPPCISGTGHDVLITACERARYRVDYGVAQHSCGGARICGDAAEFFGDGKGRALMILSDGMGTGGRAAVDGAMASGLMARLIKAGFGFDCSLRIVNSAMLFKSTDESLATVDIACIDLFSGRTDLYKAGACPTIVRRNGRTGKAECSSLPAGILRDIGFDCAGINLGRGDIVLMMSDGAYGDGVEWICGELEHWGDGTAQQLAEHILSNAVRRRNDGHEDDVTVMAAIIEDAV